MQQVPLKMNIWKKYWTWKRHVQTGVICSPDRFKKIDACFNVSIFNNVCVAVETMRPSSHCDCTYTLLFVWQGNMPAWWVNRYWTSTHGLCHLMQLSTSSRRYLYHCYLCIDMPWYSYYAVVTVALTNFLGFPLCSVFTHSRDWSWEGILGSLDAEARRIYNAFRYSRAKEGRSVDEGRCSLRRSSAWMMCFTQQAHSSHTICIVYMLTLSYICVYPYLCCYHCRCAGVQRHPSVYSVPGSRGEPPCPPEQSEPLLVLPRSGQWGGSTLPGRLPNPHRWTQ